MTTTYLPDAPTKIPSLDDVMRRVIAPWQLDRLIRGFADQRSHMISGFFGGSWGRDGGRWFQVDRAGIRIEDMDENLAKVTVVQYTWAQIGRRVAQIPADAAARLEWACDAHLAHQAAWPVFAATPAAQGCGRRPEIGPPTEAQALFEAEHEAWCERREAWYVAGRPLDDECDAARAACYVVAEAQLDMFAGATP